jgi:hypothetical protein
MVPGVLLILRVTSHIDQLPSDGLGLRDRRCGEHDDEQRSDEYSSRLTHVKIPSKKEASSFCWHREIDSDSSR